MWKINDKLTKVFKLKKLKKKLLSQTIKEKQKKLVYIIQKLNKF